MELIHANFCVCRHGQFYHPEIPEMLRDVEVVKVVRPRVRERLAVDFECVQLAARLADLILGEDPAPG